MNFKEFAKTIPTVSIQNVEVTGCSCNKENCQTDTCSCDKEQFRKDTCACGNILKQNSQ